MARSKKTPFPIWQSCKPDGIEQRYIRLGNSQLVHPVLRELSPLAFKVYTYMLLESGGSRTFTYPHSKFKGLVSNNGFQSVKEELIKAGLIMEIENNANLRKANVYEFSDIWKCARSP